MNYTVPEQTAPHTDASQAGLNKDTSAILGRHLQVKNVARGDLMLTSNFGDFSWVSSISC